jgi:hypothetical protein
MNTQPEIDTVENLSCRALASEVVRRAIARRDDDAAYHQAMRKRFEAISEDEFKRHEGGFQELRRWEEWLGLAGQAELESSFHLTRVVLAFASDVEGPVKSFHDAERRLFPPTALDDGNRMFVAYPNDDGDYLEPGKSHKDNRIVMNLVVLDAARIARLTA